jgi:hypothetical protein
MSSSERPLPTQKTPETNNEAFSGIQTRDTNKRVALNLSRGKGHRVLYLSNQIYLSWKNIKLIK